MPTPAFIRAQLVLPVTDVKASCGWYAEVLGFKPVWVNTDPEDDPDGNYAILKRDGAEIHLIRDAPPREHPWMAAGTGYLFLLVREVEALFRDLETRGATIVRPLRQESWGALAFQLKDPSGNLI